MSTENFPFPIGAVVKLKSGGPEMTVEEFGSYNLDPKTKAKCIYFDRTNKRIEEYFTPETLTDVNSEIKSKDR